MVNKDSLDKMVKIMKPLHEESDRHLMRYFGKILKAYWVYPSLVGVTLSGESTRRAADDT